MANKMNIIIVITIVLLLAFLGLYMYYLYDEFGSVTTNDNDKVTLTVSSEGPFNLKKITEDIKTKHYYKGYNNDTLKWMELLPADYVWMGNGSIVIMSYWDSTKIPTEHVCDAYITQTIKCDVIENRSLSGATYSKDIYYVKNVEFIGSETGYCIVEDRIS